MKRKAGLAPAFLLVAFGDQAVAASRKNKFFRYEFSRLMVYYDVAGWRVKNMRIFVLGMVAVAVTLPCYGQTILKSEPLVLAPYEVAFVQDAACPVGQVLKVTGAIRGLHRRKICVTPIAEQASLAIATP